MEYKQEEKSTQTIVLEKPTKSAESTQSQPSVHTALNINLFSSDSLTKKQPEPTAVTESQDKDEKLEKLKQQIMQTQREKQQKELEIKKAEKEQQKAEAEKEEQKEEEKEQEKVVESLYDASLLIKPSENEDVEKELQNLTNEGQKSYKFRFRLLTGVFCCIMAILVGWIIGNSIELATTSEQIASSTATQEEYNVNIAEYLSKISRLDSDVQQSDGPADDSLLPIDEIITITPQPLEDPTAYEEESNWFDSICNWLIHLFGG